MSGTLKLVHGLKASHLEYENSEGFVVGHHLVTVTLPTLLPPNSPQELPKTRTSHKCSLGLSFFISEMGRKVSLTHFT